MLKRLVTLIAMSGLIVLTGCGLASSILGGNNAGTVSNLWSDVPPLQGASKANINLPVEVQVIIQGFIQAANANSSDAKLESFNFIVYNTSQTPQQVADFYTNDRMQRAGWNGVDTTGCTAGSDMPQGAFCAFGKRDSTTQQTVLLIVPVQDDSTKQTNIFYVRIQASSKTP